MAETETVENEAPETQTETVEYDESLLTIVKGKAVEPQKPDFTESRLFQSKLREEAKKYLDRNQEINAILKEISQKQSENKAGNQDISTRLQNLRTQKNTLIAKRSAIRDRFVSLTNQRSALRAAGQKTLKAAPAAAASFRADFGGGLPSSDRLEAEFRRLAAAAASGDERATGQAQALQPLRGLLDQIAECESRIQSCEEERNQIQGQLAGVDVLLDATSAEFDVGRDHAGSVSQQIRKMQTELRSNSDLIRTLHKEIDSVREVDDAAYEEFIRRDRAFRAWRRAEAQKRRAEIAKEREARRKEREARDSAAAADGEEEEDSSDADGEDTAANASGNGSGSGSGASGEAVAKEGASAAAAVAAPGDSKLAKRVAAAAESFAEEIRVCEQLTSYLRGPVGQSTSASAEKGAAGPATPLPPPAGFKPLTKQSFVAGDSLFGGRQPGGKKAAKAAKAAAAPASSSSATKSVKMLFPLDLIAAFSRVGVALPPTSEQVPTALTALEEARLKFLKKREEKVAEASSGKSRRAERSVARSALKEEKDEKKVEEEEEEVVKEEKKEEDAVAIVADAAAQVSTSRAVEEKKEASPAEDDATPVVAKPEEGKLVSLRFIPTESDDAVKLVLSEIAASS